MAIPLPKIIVSWNPPESANQDTKYRVYISLDRNTWEFVTETSATRTEVSTPTMQWNRFYYILVRSVSNVGIETPLTDSTVDYILTFQPDLLENVSISGLTAGVEGRTIWVQWNSDIGDIVEAYELRLGSSWDTAEVLTTDHKSNTFQFPVRGNFTHTILIKAKDGFSELSTNTSSITVDIPNLIDWPTEYAITESDDWSGTFEGAELRAPTLMAGVTQVFGIAAQTVGTYPAVATGIVGTYTTAEIDFVEEFYGEIGVITEWARRDVMYYGDNYAKWDLPGLTWNETFFNTMTHSFRRYAGGSWSDYTDLLAGQQYYLSKLQVRTALTTSDGWVSPEVGTYEIRVSKDRKDAKSLDGLTADELPSWGGVRIVAKEGGAPYTTIQSAIDSITDASASKHYLVMIMPGLYEERVTLKEWIDVEGNVEGEVLVRGGHTSGLVGGSFSTTTNIELRNLSFEDDGSEASATEIIDIYGQFNSQLRFKNVTFKMTVDGINAVRPVMTSSTISFTECTFDTISGDSANCYYPINGANNEVFFTNCVLAKTGSTVSTEYTTLISSEDELNVTNNDTIYVDSCTIHDTGRITSNRFRGTPTIYLSNVEEPSNLSRSSALIGSWDSGGYAFDGTLHISSSRLGSLSQDNQCLELLGDFNLFVSNTSILSSGSLAELVILGHGDEDFTAEISNCAFNGGSTCLVVDGGSGAITRVSNTSLRKGPSGGFDVDISDTGDTYFSYVEYDPDTSIGENYIQHVREEIPHDDVQHALLDTVSILSQPTGATDVALGAVGGVERYAQGFQLLQRGELKSLTLKLRKEGAPIGNVWVELWDATAATLANQRPDNLLATSQVINALDLSTSLAEYEFVFDRTNTDADTDHVDTFWPYNISLCRFWVLRFDYAPSGSDRIHVALSTTNPYSQTYALQYSSGTWSAVNTGYDFFWRVNLGFNVTRQIALANTPVGAGILPLVNRPGIIMVANNSTGLSKTSAAPVALGDTALSITTTRTCMFIGLAMGLVSGTVAPGQIYIRPTGTITFDNWHNTYVQINVAGTWRTFASHLIAFTTPSVAGTYTWSYDIWMTGGATANVTNFQKALLAIPID